MTHDDTYGRIGYRGLIAWSSRLEREWPFLEAHLASAPERSVVDLGCGPGEHLARFARDGWRSVGVDRSPAQIADARRHHTEVAFLEGSMEDLAELTTDRFGAALCIGNALPSLDDERLDRLLAGLAARLRPGGIFVTQLLNYVPILAGTKRALPVTVRPAPVGGAGETGAPEDGETVFLRLFAPDPDPRYIQFLPTTLHLQPESAPPLQLRSSDRIRHRGWLAGELEARLGAHGFSGMQRFGGMDGSAWEADRSADLVLTARRD